MGQNRYKYDRPLSVTTYMETQPKQRNKVIMLLFNKRMREIFGLPCELESVPVLFTNSEKTRGGDADVSGAHAIYIDDAQ